MMPIFKKGTYGSAPQQQLAQMQAPKNDVVRGDFFIQLGWGDAPKNSSRDSDGDGYPDSKTFPLKVTHPRISKMRPVAVDVENL
jgi:hypothetical protein